HAAAADDLDEDLVAERRELDAGDGRAPHHEVAAHRIADAAENAGQDEQPEELGAARQDAAQHAPVRDPAALDVPAADGQVGAALDLAEQLDRDLGRVLQIGVDDREHVAAGRLPAADDRRRQAPLADAADDAHFRVALRDLLGDLPGPVG